MKVGFTDVDFIPENLHTPDYYSNYSSYWLGQSCGCRYRTDKLLNTCGIVVMSGHISTPQNNNVEETVHINTKNGPLTINSIKRYA
jgi:hypothetical protein